MCAKACPHEAIRMVDVAEPPEFDVVQIAKNKVGTVGQLKTNRRKKKPKRIATARSLSGFSTWLVSLPVYWSDYSNRPRYCFAATEALSTERTNILIQHLLKMVWITLYEAPA